MAEDIKSLAEACYELDSNYPSQFSMLNEAHFNDTDGVELVTLDEVKDPKGEYTEWTITIKQGKRIGEVMDRVPLGIINKTITGLGATTLEIMNQERDSIIVVPTKSLAYSKYKSANLSKGDGYALYFGSPIKEIKSNVTPRQVQAYLNSNNHRKKKFLVVADSLPRLIKILESNGIDVYHNYFLMVDEIDTMQADSAYRPRLEDVMDYYFKFDWKHRSAVSATLNDFSNPLLENESRVTTRWKDNPKRNIDLIYTNYVDDTAVEIIRQKLTDNPNDKILVAYNSLDGILAILEQLNIGKSTCGILCSERSTGKIRDYLEDTDNVIDEFGNLQKRVVFMTCAYFAGIDILDRCHLITISSYRQPFTYLSVNRMTQVAGRCRNGNISETIIYDIAQRQIRNEYANSKEYRKGLISRAEAYANFLNQMRTMIEADINLKPLEAFLDSYVDFAARSKPDQQSYPLRIIRQNCIDKKFVPAYFNIDALLERWNLYHDLYSDKENLKVKLSENNAVHFKEEFITGENHNALAVSIVKANNRERMERTFPDLKNKLQEWYMDGMDEADFNEIINGYDKKWRNVCKAFHKLCKYIHVDALLDGLEHNYTDGRRLRNYVNAAIFHALPEGHQFKALVLARFKYNEIINSNNRRGLGRYTSQERKDILKGIFKDYFHQDNIIDDDTLMEFFKCFFKTTQTGHRLKIHGLNPENLPTVQRYMPNNADLLQLFMFPNAND